VTTAMHRLGLLLSRVDQLEAAAEDPAHPTHEASVWVLRRYRELLHGEILWGDTGAPGDLLDLALKEYRALNPEDSQP